MRIHWSWQVHVPKIRHLNPRGPCAYRKWSNLGCMLWGESSILMKHPTPSFIITHRCPRRTDDLPWPPIHLPVWETMYMLVEVTSCTADHQECCRAYTVVTCFWSIQMWAKYTDLKADWFTMPAGNEPRFQLTHCITKSSWSTVRFRLSGIPSPSCTPSRFRW
jgi:hypothetical protein